MQMQFSEENNLLLFLFACARKQAALFVLLQRSTRNISKWTLRENNDYNNNDIFRNIFQ